MSCFLRRAFLAAAKAMVHHSYPVPFLGRFLPSYAVGHLGLANARSGLRELNVLLTPEAFLLDAVHGLAASVLYCLPISGGMSHMLLDYAPEFTVEAESDGRADKMRLGIALVTTKDVHFEDTLDALAVECPEDSSPCASATAICYLVSQVDEGGRWLADITKVDC